MKIFSAEEILKLVNCVEAVDCMRNAFHHIHVKNYIVPQRMHLELGELTYLVMPALGPNYSCTKLVSVVPSNPAKGLPLIQGSVILSDIRTGVDLGLFDAPMITAIRTAAVAYLAMSTFSPSSANKIGIIGCGLQGYWQTKMASANQSISDVFCYTRSPDNFFRYKKKLLVDFPDLEVTLCDHPDHVIQQAPIIYTCTDSADPVFSDDQSLVSNKLFVSVGSYKHDMQELPDAVYEYNDTIIVDTLTALKEVGDVIIPVNKGMISEKDVIPMSTVLSDSYEWDSNRKVTIKTVGMAAFDLALSGFIYEQYQKTNCA